MPSMPKDNRTKKDIQQYKKFMRILNRIRKLHQDLDDALGEGFHYKRDPSYSELMDVFRGSLDEFDGLLIRNLVKDEATLRDIVWNSKI